MVDEVQRQKQKPKRIRGGGKDLKVLENIKKLDSMKYTPPKLTEEEALEKAIKRLMDDMSAKPLTDEQIKEGIKLRRAKGGMVKKYMGGGSVHKKKNKMATTRGWGASRKT
jgi:hypothetical protein